MFLQLYCRALVRTYACHRCVGFDHKVSSCRMNEKNKVCRQCGQAGHNARGCINPVDCRSCRFKGYPSTHHMLSPGFPVYAAVLARVTLTMYSFIQATCGKGRAATIELGV